MAKRAPKARKKTVGKTAKRPLVVPSPEDAALFEGKAKPLDVDVEAHLRWLETGEGEPWPPGSSS